MPRALGTTARSPQSHSGPPSLRAGVAGRYLLALGFVAIAVLIRVGLAPLLGAAFPYAVVLVGVLLAAWYCGPGPAAAAAILELIGIEYFIRDTPSDWSDYPLRLAVILALNAIVIGFAAKIRSERDKLRQAETDLKRNDAALMQSEARLKESERRLRATFDKAAVGITETNSERRFVAVNDRMCRMTGYSREELLRMAVRDITAPEDCGMSEELSARLRDGLEERLDYDKRYLRRDGSRFWGHVTASAARDDAGHFLYAIGTIEDISERKRAEAALARERDLLQAIIDGAKNSHLVYLDRDFNFVRVNETYAATCGYRPEEMIGKNHFALYPHAENEAIFTRVRDTGEPFEVHDKPFEFPDQPDRGVTYWDWTLIPVKDGEGKVEGLVFSLFETTQRKRAEEALARANKRLHEADRRKDEFLAVLSHELRNPLAAIRNAEYILKHSDPDSEQHLLGHEIIARQAEHLTRLVDELLDVTRIARGKIKLKPERADIAETIRRTAADHNVMAAQKGVELTLDLPAGCLWANVDSTRIIQAVGNLLQNAIKFTPPGGRITVVGSVCGKTVQVRVVDTGIGIEPDVIGHLFTPFFQVESSPGRTEGGLGLGLSLVKGIVELHGGTVSVASEGIGKGSQFTIRLPLQAKHLPS